MAKVTAKNAEFDIEKPNAAFTSAGCDKLYSGAIIMIIIMGLPL